MNKTILDTDSYKFSHWKMLPPNTTEIFEYMESRGGQFGETVFFGLRPILKRLAAPITQEDVEYADERVAKHLGDKNVFNRQGWEYIVKEHGGFLPLRIKSVREGSVIPTRNVLLTLQNTCPKCAWLPGHVETQLMRTWYPTTVATLSREVKKIILRHRIDTGTPEGIHFALHDFGSRATTVPEQATIGGAAHLVNFLGSDTFLANELLYDEYGEDMASFSIPATEHSIMCARGPEGEVDVMKQFLDTFKDGPYPAIACVSDTYNLWKAAKEYWGGQLKNIIESMNDKVLVVRPDSGDPVTIVTQLIETLDESFGHTVNSKGYKVLNHVRVIQGDGVNLQSIAAILEAVKLRGYSSDNLAFGMGGALLQSTVNRDTQKFAIKASSYIIDGYVKNYRKDPITDAGKRSKLGKLKLIKDKGIYSTVSSTGDDGLGLGLQDELITVFENGKILYTPTLADIRELAKVEMDGYRL
jgi:nicotinamide phosphoribosyltransferase